MKTAVRDGHGGVLVASFEAGESLLAAAGSLVDHAGGLRVERARDVSLRSVANAAEQRERSALRATADRATSARFAPRFRGELAGVDLDGGALAVAGEGFLAATGDVELGADRVGPGPERGLGLLLTTVTGDGTAFVAGRGRVERVDLGEDGERFVTVDHVVAYERGVDASVERESAVDDARAVCRFEGSGAVWVSTRPRNP